MGIVLRRNLTQLSSETEQPFRLPPARRYSRSSAASSSYAAPDILSGHRRGAHCFPWHGQAGRPVFHADIRLFLGFCVLALGVCKGHAGTSFPGIFHVPLKCTRDFSGCKRIQANAENHRQKKNPRFAGLLRSSVNVAEHR